MALKILGFNGSPRTNWNTSMLVKKALEGARAQGAETEYVDLMNLDFKPCISCLRCKKGPGFEGRCHYRDELTPYLEKIKKCDGMIVGIPIYMGLPGALSHMFLERAIYSSYVYRQHSSVFGRKIKTGLVFAMGAPKAAAEGPYRPLIGQLSGMVGGVYGSCETLCSCDTLQVKDYSKYDIQICDPKEKLRIREEQFPKDLQAAFELGKRIATK